MSVMGDFSPEDESWHTCRPDADETPIEALLYAVSAVTNDPPGEMDPLFETIDTDAINELVAHAETTDTELAISFQYNGCRVIVDGPAVHVRAP